MWLFRAIWVVRASLSQGGTWSDTVNYGLGSMLSGGHPPYISLIDRILDTGRTPQAATWLSVFAKMTDFIFNFIHQT